MAWREYFKKRPNFQQLKEIKKFLSPQELWATKLLLAAITLSTVWLGTQLYQDNVTKVPMAGGTYVEALIGAPKFINPLLAQTNDVDTDISRLVFSGLLKFDADLNLVPDLATSYKISEDKLTYTFFLKPNAFWHTRGSEEAKPVTSDDIILTFENIQDPDFKSPLIVSFRGVQIKKVDNLTVQFILPEPFEPFLESMTFGILPAHVWQEIPNTTANLAEANIRPVGSGPWQFSTLTRDKLGNIKSYTLVPFEKYYDNPPLIQKLTFKFYPNFEEAVGALINNNVEGISFLPKALKERLISESDINFYSFDLPQYTGVFFNQKINSILKDKNVKQALAYAIDKTKIISEALSLEGQIVDGPILPGYEGYNENIEKYDFDPDKANQILNEAQWQIITADEYKQKLAEKISQERIDLQAELSQGEDVAPETIEEEVFTAPTSTEQILEEIILDPNQNIFRSKNDEILEITLTTVNQPENVTAATLVKKMWQDVGASVNLEIVDPNRIGREIIKPRNYEALLFGENLGASPDPFPFWHSSQNQDPGLNLAVFSNRNVDKLLEDARIEADSAKRDELYQEFQNIIISEIPAIFLYRPTYTYVISDKIKGLNVSQVIVPADRFNNITGWYIKTKASFAKEN
ncbi:MAG: hypothetical protein COT81_02410 [Candidatus Buchananbacteria bacterium CG10_big_fil_rev_8_21_14_0_10_42_9]|uniref:Solute-binding protein family 5 domain-containing protein n=1 Tax=Candidatus Buchananbacteria bacterium CG10_big_fil_rev_8_21_14_0_10_42_9 TaxID=1974526 RepID=A0A2H0W3E7_9BACT|nr:MAG: hypothetical protein COT81_02410 [Candidatus Buchananbacteria bacterium CG10_big_fil_rev_8_21_14_0_10_42_9]